MGQGIRRQLHGLALIAALAAAPLAPSLAAPAAPAGSAPAAAKPTAAKPAAPAAPASGLHGIPYAYRENRDTVALVEAARQAIARQGEAVFPAFRQRGGPWFQGDQYVFVWDLQGIRRVDPVQPANEGRSGLALRDAGGRPLGRMLLERAQAGEAAGWVHYQWRLPDPRYPRPVWKSSYVARVTAPSGRTYLVGSGNYEGRVEKGFVVEEVKAAAALLRRQGRAAFPELRDPKGRFVFHETYVFVDTTAGVELVNPAFPEVEGRNLISLRDVTGKPMVRDYIDLALRKGSGWTTYLWPQPGRSRLPLEKHTYVEKVVLPDGEVLIVGSGVYEP